MFIQKLKTAVKNRDKDYIETIVASESFIPQERTTKEEFMKFYFKTSYRAAKFWENLEYIFTIGGGAFNPKNQNEYFLPYTSANIYNSQVFSEVGSYVLSLSDSTPIYAQPNDNSRIVAHFNYEAAPVNHTENKVDGWYAIDLNSGELGFIQEIKALYTISTRCGLIKENGIWKLQYADSFD